MILLRPVLHLYVSRDMTSFQSEMRFEIETPDEHCIVLHLSGDATQRVVLALHGITSECTEGGLYLSLASRLHSQGVSTATFDFRGHGRSPTPFRSATVSGMVLDFICVYDFLVNHFDEVDIVCASFGASIALLASRVHALPQTRRVVMWNPVVSYTATFTRASTEWGRKFYPQLELGQAFRVSSHAVGESGLALGREMISQIALMSPELESFGDSKLVTLIHSKQDSIVPFAATEQYAVRHGLMARLHSLDGADHGFDGFENEILGITDAALLQ